MQTILHMATTLDGFIAREDGDSDWISDIDGKLFENRCKETGCVIVGSKTFKQFENIIYPIKGTRTIIITHDKNLSFENKDVLVAHSPQESLEIAKNNGYEKVLIAGGGKTSASFLDLNLIDEIFFSVHPVTLGKGIKLFEGAKKDCKLNLLGSREIGEGIIELHYKPSL